LRVIGSVAEVLLATTQRAAILRIWRAQHPYRHLHRHGKGYCRAGDGSLDLARAEASRCWPTRSPRKAAGIGGLTLLSCDNLADNGHQLRRLMGEYLAARHPDLLDWAQQTCTSRAAWSTASCPPPPMRTAAGGGRAGLRDEGVVMTEPFSQWVIEDAFAGPRPAWWAQIVADVAPYETAKLRMLNGAHSALAYCGWPHLCASGGGRPALRALAARVMREEAAPPFRPRRHGSGRLCRCAARSVRQPRAQPPADPDRDGRQPEDPAALAGNAGRQPAQGAHARAAGRHRGVDRPYGRDNAAAGARWTTRAQSWPLPGQAPGRMASWRRCSGASLLASEWLPGEADKAAIRQRSDQGAAGLVSSAFGGLGGFTFV
jgi:hypothetical protein